MLTVNNVSKSFSPSVQILNEINITVAEGEIACLLGPSGCGKTTLLRIIAGLEDADQGQIVCQGQAMAGVPVHQRRFGFMFQDFALFPHKTVGQNIAFGLKMSGWDRQQIYERVVEMLALVNMSGYEDRSPLSLSGGEQQRVALARSLAPSPRLLMLDEPLGSLDRGLRESLMNELRAILKNVGVTALYVTHDQEEAYAVADKLVVMNKGQVMQQGAPMALYSQPANAFVARFLGFTNLLAGEVLPYKANHIVTALGSWPLMRATNSGAYICLIRPNAAKVIDEAMPENLTQLGSPQSALSGPSAAAEIAAGAQSIVVHGTVTETSFRGSVYQIGVRISTADGAKDSNKSNSEQTLLFELPTDVVDQTNLASQPESRQTAFYQPGQPISLAIDPNQITLLTSEK